MGKDMKCLYCKKKVTEIVAVEFEPGIYSTLRCKDCAKLLVEQERAAFKKAIPKEKK